MNFLHGCPAPALIAVMPLAIELQLKACRRQRVMHYASKYTDTVHHFIELSASQSQVAIRLVK